MNNGFTGTITSTATFNSDVQTREIDFIYDHNGMRTTKIVSENGRLEITEYTLHGKLITHMTKRTVDESGAESTEELHFFYDAQSRPTFVKWNNAIYRYVHNLQGDIVGIVDNTGNLVVEYRYDAWGNHISAVPELGVGAINPFRYRGYVYDEESDLYYLENRYYLSCINRFINGDWVFLNIYPRTSKPLYQNLFAYCENNPVTKFDPYGLWSWKTVLKAVATVAVVVATIAISASIGGPVGTVSAVKNGVTMVCAVVDGAVSAIVAESGTGEEGDMVDVAINGALCGALGGCAGIVADTCLGRYIKGPEDYVGMTSTVGRAVSSTVYDLSYALIAHGEITSNDVTLCVIDIVMDSMYSTVYYSYSGSIKNTGIQAAVNGVVDGIVDVYQTDQLYKTKLKNYGGFRNMQQEIKYMYA